MTAERALARVTDLLLFESAYIARCFAADVGNTRALQKVIFNGITAAEMQPVAPNDDAADFVYVGELRSAKGIDTMVDALAVVARATGKCPRAVLVGSGPDQQLLAQRAKALGLEKFVSFPGPMPARQAFKMGRTLVVPSRAESLPYVVLEAAGAQIPMIATNVGGIPEIFGPYSDRLIACDDVDALSRKMIVELSRDETERGMNASSLGAFVAERFTISNMADAVVAGYRDALALRNNEIIALPATA
jgi:glycosyltransferase involved in cell wall biosynthesis